MAGSDGESLSLESLFAFVGGLDANDEDANDKDAKSGGSSPVESGRAPDAEPAAVSETLPAEEVGERRDAAAVETADRPTSDARRDDPPAAIDGIEGIDLGLLSFVAGMPMGSVGLGAAPVEPAPAKPVPVPVPAPAADVAQRAEPTRPAPVQPAQPSPPSAPRTQAPSQQVAAPQVRVSQQGAAPAEPPAPRPPREAPAPVPAAVPAPAPPRGKHASGVRLRERAFGGRHAASAADSKPALERVGHASGEFAAKEPAAATAELPVVSARPVEGIRVGSSVPARAQGAADGSAQARPVAPRAAAPDTARSSGASTPSCAAADSAVARRGEPPKPSKAEPRKSVPLEGTSASIDARLEALVQERLAQLRGNRALGDGTAGDDGSSSAGDDLLKSLARMLALDDEAPAHPRAAGEPADAPAASERVSAPVEAKPDVAKEPAEPNVLLKLKGLSKPKEPSESKTFSESSSPKAPPARSVPKESNPPKEPSSADKLDSVMFEEPPASIKEVMREAEGLHKRAFVIKAAAVAASSILVLGLGAFAFSQFPGTGSAGPPADVVDVQPSEGDAQDEADGQQKASQAAKGADEERDRSGEVVYRYALEADGETRSVTETVTFGKDGTCETSSLEVELADEDAAASYLGDLERDFGTALESGQVDGTVVRVTVDVSSNELDREGYEDALRVSVEDLAIVKKS